MHLVIKDKFINIMDNVKIALPWYVVGLQYRDLFHKAYL